MRPTRAALLVAATCLTPALLLATPAFAAGPAVTPTPTHAKAASGTPVDEMSKGDLAFAIARLLAEESTGQGVRREARKALDGTVEDMRAFVKTGYRLARAEDDRFAILRMLNRADLGPALRKAAEKAVSDNVPEDMRHFLEVGQYELGAK
ncbi:ALF repeat-containing protein [Streptomyces rimosus]|uniref:ALF repeat-containing protein n=1 Tax=Streptomyces rimosus TaxID=1927 RepID=UPI0004C69D45|nr:ALF repeat-containing protein [Streptomyces rimosus]